LGDFFPDAHLAKTVSIATNPIWLPHAHSIWCGIANPSLWYADVRRLSSFS
jgi:hypothetical protein